MSRLVWRRDVGAGLHRVGRLAGRRWQSQYAIDAPDFPALSLGLPTYAVWGSNTNVGKTLFSMGLAQAAVRAGLSVDYIKPVQTGFPAESDAARVASVVEGGRHLVSPHAARLCAFPPAAPLHPPPRGSFSCTARTLFAWAPPMSPHAAALMGASEDAETASEASSHPPPPTPTDLELQRAVAAAHGEAGRSGAGLALVETAGGPCSPAPSGSLQAAVLAPLRWPALLVGDGALGGISATLAAADALELRGHDISAVVLAEGERDARLSNAAALERSLRGRGVAVCVFAALPAAGCEAALRAWLGEQEPAFDALLGRLREAHERRVRRLRRLPLAASQVLWWPFTQHGSLPRGWRPTLFEGRHGDRLLVVGLDGDGTLEQAVDGCASWWTQGMDAESHPRLVRALARGAARYGHVMLPQCAHEPAVGLAERLLASAGRGWAARVFYSDDGSTAVEVALKMAFRAHAAWNPSLGGRSVGVLGLREGYHGDTLGAMDAVAPSPYNGPRQTPWYRPRGCFLEAPTLGLERGRWVLRWGRGRVLRDFETLREAFEEREGAAPGGYVREYAALIVEAFEGGDEDQGIAERREPASRAPQPSSLYPNLTPGALLLEPVLQGAGGMRLVDPAFQRLLVDEARRRRVPVVFDEVFSGLWRLGAASAGLSLLRRAPDIMCVAKLLTGGVVPLAATLATDAVFRAFGSPRKLDSLLHGHSYSGHAVGCAAAVAALDEFEARARRGGGGDGEGSAQEGSAQEGSEAGRGSGQKGDFEAGFQHRAALSSLVGYLAEAGCGPSLPDLWPADLVRALSCHPRVQSVVALGTVLAAELAGQGGGYSSDAAAGVVEALGQRGVFARPLGSVVYLMTTPLGSARECRRLAQLLLQALDAAPQ